MGVNYDKQINYYVHLKLSWNLKRMLMINKMNVTVKDLVGESAVNNLLVFIMFGLSEPNLQRAIDIVEGWVEFFGDYKTLKTLILVDLKNNFKFIREKDKNKIVDVFEMSDNTDTKELTHEEILKIERDNLEHVIKVYMKCGYSYEQALEMDMSNYEFFNDYILDERDKFRTDLHDLGRWIAVGVNNPDRFKDTLEEVRLKPLSEEEKLKQIKEDTVKMFNEVEREVENNGK